jgi:hypothetical protein
MNDVKALKTIAKRAVFQFYRLDSSAHVAGVSAPQAVRLRYYFQFYRLDSERPDFRTRAFKITAYFQFYRLDSSVRTHTPTEGERVSFQFYRLDSMAVVQVRCGEGKTFNSID